jgi:hypothetical protein
MLVASFLSVSPSLVLNAQDEELDTIVQDINGTDHIVTLAGDGTLYWVAYSPEDPVPDDGFYMREPYVVVDVPALITKKPKKNDGGVKAPRQPTAYNMFLKQKLRELSKTHSHMSNKERMKLASEEWKAMKGAL